MKLLRTFLAGMALSIGATTVQSQPATQPAGAVEPTPQGCQWYERADRQTELFCQDDLGRYRPTGEVRAVTPSVADGCGAGQVYDGVRCVSEATALEARERGGAGPVLIARPEPARRDGMICEPYAVVRAGAPGQSGAPLRTGAICQ